VDRVGSRCSILLTSVDDLEEVAAYLADRLEGGSPPAILAFDEGERPLLGFVATSRGDDAHPAASLIGGGAVAQLRDLSEGGEAAHWLVLSDGAGSGAYARAADGSLASVVLIQDGRRSEWTPAAGLQESPSPAPYQAVVDEAAWRLVGTPLVDLAVRCAPPVAAPAADSPRVERAPGGRAICLACSTKIDKGELRVVVTRQVLVAGFTRPAPGYLHSGCALRSEHLTPAQRAALGGGLEG
jgi:hypothetical protein